MPSRRSVRLYEVGLRIVQAAEVFDCDDDQLGYALRKSVLTRLESALRRLMLAGACTAAVSARCLSIITDCQRHLSHGPESSRVEIQTLLALLRDFCVEETASNRQLDKDDVIWLRLGLEIGRGSGEPWDPGRLEFRDGRLSGVRGTERPATWEWPNRDAVDELLEQLSERVETLFPGYNKGAASDRELNEDDGKAMPNLPDGWWGWRAIEKGLRALYRNAEHATPEVPPAATEGSPAGPTVQQHPLASSEESQEGSLPVPEPSNCGVDSRSTESVVVQISRHDGETTGQSEPVDDKQHKPNCIRKPWAHSEPPDAQAYCGGRMEGQLKELAKWADVDVKTLKKMNKDGTVWIVRQHAKRWSLWFKTQPEYEAAWRRQTGEKSEVAHEGTKRDRKG